MKIAVLGGGMVAAFVRRACVDHGVEPDVYAPKLTHMPPPGAVWIYGMPRGYPQPIQRISVRGIGDPRRYAISIYGRVCSTSFPALEYETHGYDPYAVLPYLWDGATAIDTIFDDQRQIDALTDEYDAVFQTFHTGPAPTRIVMYACERKIELPLGNVVVYDGSSDNCVRYAYLFGRENRECVVCDERCEKRSVSGRIERITKISPFSDTPAGLVSANRKIVRIGRQATWKRKYLAHQAYGETCSILFGRSSADTTI